MGLTRKPTAIRKLEGNRGKRALPQNEPTPALGASMPRNLSPIARQQWAVVAKQLMKVRVLTKMDEQALALYCEAYARWRLAQDQLDQGAPMVEANPKTGALHVSPYFTIVEKSQAQMVKLLMEFGMTPASRGRVAAAPETPEQSVTSILDGADDESESATLQ